LLLGDLSPTSGNLAGYMPFKQQYGLIFIPVTGTDANSLSRIVAHEVGHGAFRLYHTFSSENPYTESKGQTNNLMDYNNGIHLHKYQWDYIHDPQAMIAWAMDDEEMAAYGNNCVFTEWIEKIRHAAQNNEKISRNYGINEALESIKLSDNSYYSDIRIYSRNGFNVTISENNVKIHEYERTGETLTYFQFGEQIDNVNNIPVYELEIITPTENKDKLYKYLFDKENWELEVRNHFINKMIDGRVAAVEFLDCLPDEYYKDITLLHRMDILNTLNEANNISEKWFGSPNEEGVAIQIIKTTPEDQVAELFNRLEQDGLIIDLYKKIDDVFGADNQTKFMCELLMLYYSQSQYYLNNCTEQTGYYCPWLQEESYSYSYNTIFNGNRINITADYSYLLGGSGYGTENNVITYDDLSPFSCIAVDFITVIDFIGIKGGVDGQIVPMPAIFFKWLNDEVIKREIEKVAEFSIKIAAFTFGAGEIAAADKAYKVILSLVSFVSSSQDLFFELTEINADNIENDNVKRFYSYWNNLRKPIPGANSVDDIIQSKLPLFYLLESCWNIINQENLDLKMIFGNDYEKIETTLNLISNHIK
jgi:hypothetical protein